MNKVILTAVLFAAVLLTACDGNRVYENNITIDDHVWDVKKPISFEVNITDTESPHNVYLNVRNAGGYPYSNLYVFFHTEYPDQTVSVDTLECILADPSGKWLGDGSGDIWDNQILFKKNVRFPKAGKYTFIMEQAMRQEKLPMIMEMGLRIEKAGN